MAKELLSVDDLSEYLNIKKSTIYCLVENRKLPHYRIGRLIRFKQGDVDAWMEKQKEPVIDVKTEARKVVRSIEKKSDLDAGGIVKKAIEDTNKKRYNPLSQEKPGGIEGLETEVKHGIV